MRNKKSILIRKFVVFLFIGSMLLSSLFALTGCSAQEDSIKIESPQTLIDSLMTAWKSRDEETFKSFFSNPDEIKLRYDFIDANANGDENLKKTSARIQKEIYQNVTYDISDIETTKNNKKATAQITIHTIDMKFFLEKYFDIVKNTEYDVTSGSAYLIKSKMNEEIYNHIDDYIRVYEDSITLHMIHQDKGWVIYNGDELLNILTGGYLGG